jgi:hypothetical protein
VVKEVRLTPKELREKFGSDVTAFNETDLETKESTMYLPYRAGTGLRLHELYHSRPTRELKSEGTAEEFVREELEAVEFTRSKRGQSDSIPGPSIDIMLGSALDLYPAGKVMTAVIKVFKEKGFEVTPDKKREIWDFIKWYTGKGRSQ